MAGTTAPRRKRAKQRRLEGVEEDERIREIADAAENYVEARDERMAKTEAEVEAKTKLISVMGKHKKEVYRGDGWSITVDHKESTNVKVSRIEDEENESED